MLNLARGGTCEGREGTERPAGCPTSAGNPECCRQMEACSCAKSDARQLCVRQQYSVSGAPRSRQVNRIRAAEWNCRSTAEAAERGSAGDRGSGDVVGGEWMRSRCQMKLRSMTCSDKMETKCGIDARML